MIKIILNYTAAAVAYIMAFYLFNMSMDEINFGSAYIKHIEPLFGIPAAVVCIAAGLYHYHKADKLTEDRNDHKDEQH